MLTSLQWLEITGNRYLRQMESEDVVFLNQIEIGTQEHAQLIENLTKNPNLIWADWANACVAVAVVQVAREAEGEETSLPRLFLACIGCTYDQHLWEENYGKRIEQVIHRYFPDDYVGYGGFRYVGPVYRHCGIPSIATRRFGRLVRDLLRNYGPSFTRDEYERVREPIGGVASRFLASEHGYIYTKKAVTILNRIDLRQIADKDVDVIPGFRHGFWREILEGAGGRQPVNGGRTDAAVYNEPYLAYSAENCRLEIRFDWRGVQRGIFRLNNRRVTNAAVCWSSSDRPNIHIRDRQFSLDRWWYPGATKAALFRCSDGGFVVGRGGVPPGSYFLITEDETAASEWVQEELISIL